MRILLYECHATSKSDRLHFPMIRFGKLNLVVGDSATGKTRLLNTIVNGAKLATKNDERHHPLGKWDITFEQDGKTYRWRMETGKRDESKGEESFRIVNESISILEGDEEIAIVRRDVDSFIFRDQNLPRLSPQESSISILQEEELIRPIYKGMSSIMRRNFSGPDLERQAAFQAIPQDFLRMMKKTKDLNILFSADLSLSGALYILSQNFSESYERICSEFQTIFPFVSQVKLLNAEDFGLYLPGLTPIFSLKERDADAWVPLPGFSSGMRKVLLMLTDIFTLPADGGVYLIDEYENSLGISAINFFPSVLLDVGTPSQFIVTSHHPYIIGNVPVRNWIVLHRKGFQVQVKQGEELEGRFGKSKQQAFVQLINDPFYVAGVE